MRTAPAHLQIGKDFELPLEFVTQTSALIGKRGVGKTHCAVVFAEELLEARLPVVIIDPIGVWWGLRSSANGKTAGHPILVLGGEHGDLPLDAGAGRLIADFVVSKRASVVIDLGEFSKGEQARFVTDFLERLFQKNREPLHVIIDEADAFAPQRLRPDIARCFGAVDQVVRRGRARGLGVTLVTQRSAAINKDVLSQVEVLVAFRTLAPQDRAALEGWIDVHADRAEAAKVLQSLASLEVGEAWLWSPAWLGKLERVRIRRRRTFDSSATPKMGAAAAAPRAAAAVDVDALRGELTSLVAKAEAEDPRKLRARIAELERQAAKGAGSSVELTAALGELADRDQRIAELERRMHDFDSTIALAAANLETIAGQLRDAKVSLLGMPKVHAGYRTIGIETAPGSPVPKRSLRMSPAFRALSAAPGDPAVGSGGLRRMLIALAQRPQGLSNRQLGLRAGLSSRSGTFSTYLGRARGAGWIDGRGDVRITDAGLKALGVYQPLPEGRDLLEFWLHELGASGAARMLRSLADVYPRGLTNEQLGAAAEISSRSGTFSTYLGRLRGLELVEGRGELRASEELFG